MNKEAHVKMVVLSLLPVGSEKPVTTRELLDKTGLGRRTLKKVIRELRKEYPIVSQFGNGGGYWIANNSEDAWRFVNLLYSLVISHTETITQLMTHINNMPQCNLEEHEDK